MAVADEIHEKLWVSYKDIIYIGDDLGDMKLLEKVGISAACISAPLYVQNIVNFTTKKRGEEGAFREFLENILEANRVLTKVVKDVIG